MSCYATNVPGLVATASKIDDVVNGIDSGNNFIFTTAEEAFATQYDSLSAPERQVITNWVANNPL